MSLRPAPLRGILLRSFVRCFLLAAVLFLPFLIIDKGFFLYCGDFNSQQIPFTYYLEGLAKNGLPNYAWATDLGSGLVESYSFYLLGSPFFWLGSLLPQAWSPYLMVPLLCLKFGVAGAGAALWSCRYTRTAYGAQLAALLYAFSGFTIYNVFFNHFVDVVAIFPFLLWSVDEFFENDRRGLFALLVALCLFVNYFFFVGQVVFVVLYFLFKLAGKQWRPGWKTFGLFCLEAVLGVGLAMVMALPSAYAVLRNPRVDNFSTGLDLLFYWRTQQYLAIFTSAFLPQDPSYLPNLFPDCTIKWTSMSLYLPFTGLSGVLVWMKGHKKHPMRRLLLTCMVMALVPVLNASFYAFNASFYCRWYYMPLLVMAALTANAMEEAPQQDWRTATLLCGGITAAYLLLGLLPAKDGDGNFQLGIEEDPLRLFLTLLLALGALAILYALLCRAVNRAALLRHAAAFAAMFGVVIGIYTIACGKFPQRFGDADYKMECYDHRQELQDWLDAADDRYYRIDTYESYTNLGLWLDRSCLQFFNSTVDASILEFYPSVGVKRDVNSKPELKNYALRGLLNVRYLLTPDDRVAEFFDENSYTDDWKPVANVGPYAILEYQLYVPFGTAYEYYMTETQYEALAENNRAGLLLRALVLSDEQAERYQDRIQPLPEASLRVNNYSAYTEDCCARARTACDTFAVDGDGFTAGITLEEARLVFFSIPYNEGWQVTVNGTPVPMERVDEGLCAIPVEAGENVIRGEYRAPGLRTGGVISAVSCGLLVLYLALCWPRRKRRTPSTAPCLTPAAQAAALPAWQPPMDLAPYIEAAAEAAAEAAKEDEAQGEGADADETAGADEDETAGADEYPNADTEENANTSDSINKTADADEEETADADEDPNADTEENANTSDSINKTADAATEDGPDETAAASDNTNKTANADGRTGG